MAPTPEQVGSIQYADGDYIAQAAPGGTAMVNVKVYQAAAPAPMDEATLARAEARLAELPLDTVPPPARLPSGSWLPLLPNALFVGRDRDLLALAEVLKADGAGGVGRSTAVIGIGGIGKTQLASEFAWRYGQYFAGGVFWIGCADPAAIPAEIATCGRGLNLHPDFTSLPLDGQVVMVAAVWRNKLPRLLVFDNCEDEAVLEDWLPRSGGCRVLVTARRGIWRPELGVQVIFLGILTRTESIALLRGHRPDLAADDPDLDAIAAELGDLPLALHLAGAYLALGRYEAFGRPAAYIAALRRPNLLQHQSLTLEGRSPTGHEQHVARTFALSWEQLNPTVTVDATAWAILVRAAWFATGEPIPRELLRASTGIEDKDEAAAAVFARGMARVHELGLATAQQDGALVLHRLVAAFIRGVTETNVNEAARVAVELAIVTAADRLNEYGDPRLLLAWQSQLRAVTEAAERDGRPAAGRLLNELGLHLCMVADFAGAKAALERALAINERVHGPDHPDVAIVINNLGRVLHDQGDLAGARAAIERALAIDERVNGPDHPEVAIRVNNLGFVLLAQGDLAGAKIAFERALAIDERVHGPDHPNVAIRVSNLGSVLYEQGDLAGARAAIERALAINERVHGPDHPDVATGINNLGFVLRAQGDLAGAKIAFERALAIDERVHGPDHPTVAIRLNNLGLVLRAQGDLAGARAVFERALAINERVHGPDHPTVATGINNLGGMLWDQGDLAGARAALERALAINERVHGPDHPDIAIMINNLGRVLHDQGDLAGARAVFERALAIFRSRLGEQHPRTGSVRRTLEAIDAGTVLHGPGDDIP